jgi:hypothetical protein
MENQAIITQVIAHLEAESNSKWVTSATLLEKLDIPDLSPTDLDDILVSYFQDSDDCEIPVLSRRLASGKC